MEKQVDYNKSGYIDLDETTKIKSTLFSGYGNIIFVFTILLYIFLIFSSNKVKK